MKHLKSLLLSGMLLMVSCNSDDSSTDEEMDNKLIGTWELLRYENIDGGSTNESPAGEPSITWMFSSDLSFQGFTQNNQFDGEYSIDDNIVRLTKFTFTQVSQTEWGELFFESIGESTQEEGFAIMEYSILADTLFLKYKEDRRMVWVSK